MTTSEYVHRLVIPAAYDLLPLHMASVEATAMLLAIGLQESRFEYRQQMNGPARGFWQFERGGGIAGVLGHEKTGPLLLPLCEQTFQVSPTATACHEAITHNDILATVFARLLLWTLPFALPHRTESVMAYGQYIACWRPGKPHPETWRDHFETAWRHVTG